MEGWREQHRGIQIENAARQSFLSAFFAGGFVGDDVPGNAKNGNTDVLAASNAL